MKSEFETIKSMITCSYCGEIFKKQNKALILKCAHSICQYCHKINLDSITCLVCKVKYVGKDNLNHPINFLLAEFLEKEDLNEYVKKWQSGKSSSISCKNNDEESSKVNFEKEEDNKNLEVNEKTNICINNNKNKNDKVSAEDVKRFYCSNCNLFLRNEFHFENQNTKCKFSKKDLSTEKTITENFLNDKATEKNSENLPCKENKKLTKAEILERDSNQLMKKYNELNAEINDLYEEYMKTILLNYIDSQLLLQKKINKNKLFENLIFTGIITENHFNKLLKFMLKYHKNKKLVKLIRDFSSNENIGNVVNPNENIDNGINKNNNTNNKNNQEEFNNPKEKFENFLAELNSLEKIYSNFKANEFLSDYFFFKSVLEDFKANLLNKLERLESLFTINTHESKEIEEDESRFKKKQAQDICEIYNRDVMQNLISEISNDINFSQQKDISNIKYSYFFIKKNKKLNKKENFYSPNKLDLVVFDPLTESLKKFDLETLIDQIRELYEKFKVDYSEDCLKIKCLKAFDYNYDQFGNLFLFGGYFKKIKNINIINSKEITEENTLDINNKAENKFDYIPNNLIYKINPFKKKFKIFYEFANPRFGSASIIINKNFYFLGGKSFESFLAQTLSSEKITEKESKDVNQISFGRSFKALSLKNFALTTLKEYPLELRRKPLILNHIYENIFVCEDIKNFSFYNLKRKAWKKSQIFYNSENINNISNFIAFNFNKDVILLGGIKNIKQNSLYLNRLKNDNDLNNDINENVDEVIIKEEIKDYNNQILSVERDYYSVSNVGCSCFHFEDLYEKKFGACKIREIKRIRSDVAFLSDSTYIIEYHEALEMVYIRKNTRLKSGLDFDSFKLERIDEI